MTMTKAIKNFDFKGNGISTIIDEDGNPWWVASEVCGILKLSNPSVSVQALDEDERSKFNLGRQGEGWIINEPGLYSLILRSRKKQAKEFKRWVTHEVLPSIRKTGKYALPTIPIPKGLPDFTKPGVAARAWADQVEGREVAEQKVIELQPKADKYDKFISSDGLISLSSAANIYACAHAAELSVLGQGVGVHKFNAFLREYGILQKHKRKPFQKYIDKGYLAVKPVGTGGWPQTFLTASGMDWLIAAPVAKVLSAWNGKAA